MSYCEQCGRPVPEGQRFCTDCRMKLELQRRKAAFPQQPQTPAPKPARKGGRSLPVIILSAALAAFVLFFAASLLFGSSSVRQTRNGGSLASWDGAVGTQTGTDPGPELVKVDAPYAQSVLGSTPPVAEEADGGEYLLPNVDSEYIAREVIAAMTPEQLRLARNEIYARHGRIFQDPELSAYFLSKSWYQPLYDPASFDALGDSVLNQYEIANRDLIVEYENLYSGQ